jgi:hypothetical protein
MVVALVALALMPAQASARDRPDLKVVTVSDAPAAAAAGTGFDVDGKTKNVGTKKARASLTGFFLSTDSVRSDDDTPLTGTHAVPGLKPRRSDAATTPVTIPEALTPGDYRLIACADVEDAVRESAKNNCLTAGGTIEVSGLTAVTAYEINQGTVPDGTGVSLQGLRVSAVKTAASTTTIYAQEAAGGQYGGLVVFVPNGVTPPSGLAPGDVIDTLGEVTTFDVGAPPTGSGIREVTASSVTRTTAGGSPPVALVIGAAELASTGAKDKYGGLVVEVQNVKLTSKPASGWMLTETGTNAVASVDKALIGTLPDYAVDTNFDAVGGVGYYNLFDDVMRLAPRSAADIAPA